MLAALTATAISRGWPPHVFARLVNQLLDTTNIPPEEQASTIYTCLTQNSAASPLQFEYLTLLSADLNSPVYFPFLIHKFASEKIEERSQQSKELMSYLARAADEWNLSQDCKQVNELCADVSVLLDQAFECDESRLFVASITKVVNALQELSSDFNQQTQAKFAKLRLMSCVDDLKYPYLPSQFSQPATTVEKSEKISELANEVDLKSSRSLRFLWLDWLLRTSQELDNDSLKQQLDLMWPGDRIPVVSYELLVSAFDVVAAPSAFQNASPEPALAAKFISKRLPLILKTLTLPEQTENNEVETSAGGDVQYTTKILDGVIARLFTTMDKEVVEAVEKRCPGLREEFGIACVELNLCDPTVLHALHRSYMETEQPPLPDSVNSFDITTFPTFNPHNQAIIADQILSSVRGISADPMGRHNLALFCVQLYKHVDAADELFVHIPVRDFLEAVCVNADAASALSEEEGCSSLVYDDLGVFLGFANMLVSRYNVELPEKTTWSTAFLKTKLFLHASQLSQPKQNLMGQWVVALFSKSSGGIPDELFRSFNELAEVLPALMQQSVKAYQSGVIDRHVLQSGLEHFANPYMVKLMAPLVLRVLHTDLLQTIHQSSTALECIVFLLQILSEKQQQQKQPNDLDIAISFVLVVAEQILNDVKAILNSKNMLSASVSKTGSTSFTMSSSSSNTDIKLMNALSSILDKLTQQNQADLPQVLQKWNIQKQVMTLEKKDQKPTSSLAESVKSAVSALVSWQTKPHGIPAVPTVILSQNAKPILGLETTKSIIESVCFPQSPETAVALYVADGLVCETTKIVSSGELNSASETAQNFLTQFKSILEKRDSKPKPEVIVIAPPPTIRTKTASTSSKTTTNATANSTSTGASANNNASNTNLDVSLNTDMSISPANPSPGMAMPFDMDMMMDDVDGIQNLNFDTDFTSQPMNLEDLDSAMDFGWD